MKSIKIGILPYEKIKQRMLDIAGGRLAPSPDDPKIWFNSLESLAATLNSANQELLSEIRMHPGRSVSELATATARHQGNLSRTLKNLEAKGLVRMETDQTDARRKIPLVDYDAIEPAPIMLEQCRYLFQAASTSAP